MLCTLPYGVFRANAKASWIYQETVVFAPISVITRNETSQERIKVPMKMKGEYTLKLYSLGYCSANAFSIFSLLKNGSLDSRRILLLAFAIGMLISATYTNVIATVANTETKHDTNIAVGTTAKRFMSTPCLLGNMFSLYS